MKNWTVETHGQAVDDELEQLPLDMRGRFFRVSSLIEEFELARQLIEARTESRRSQEEIATRMGTSQSAIARLESGNTGNKLALGIA